LNAKSVRVDLDEDGDEDSDELVGRSEGKGESKGDGEKVRKSNGKEGKEKETGAVYAVTAKVVDVPLEVLLGRQKEFSNFVSKVHFGFFPPPHFFVLSLSFSPRSFPVYRQSY
jgi:hypothetical protein